MRYTNLLILMVVLGGMFFVPGFVNAGYDDNVNGWAWGDITGWVSFNCLNTNSCDVSDYGVNINSSGNVGGYAWSDNFGWIYFDAVGAYPSLPNTSVQYNFGTGQFSGWARVCILADTPATCSGGSDGWLKMRCTGAECAVSNYGVYTDANGDWRNYAWGSDGIGWISFNCQDGGDCVNFDYSASYDSEEYGYASVMINSGDFITVGKTNGYGNGGFDMYVAKYATDGTLTWTRSIGGANDDVGMYVNATADGGYVITGSTKSFGAGGSDLWILKFDSSDNLTWARVVGGAADDAGTFVEELTGGHFIVTGYTRSYGGADDDIWILEFTNPGNLFGSYMVIDGAQSDIGYAIREVSDGFVLVGDTNSYGVGGSDALIMKVATDLGSITWARSVGGAANDNGRSLIIAPDGRYVMGGYMRSSGAGEEDFILLKLETDGTIPACGSINVIAPTFSSPALTNSSVTAAVNGTIANQAISESTESAIPVEQNATYASVCGISYTSATVNTLAAQNITFTSALLRGEVTNTGGNTADIVGFDYGLSTAYGSSLTTNVSSTAPPTAPFNELASGLTSYLTYHFRAKAHTIAGWFYGNDATFDTIVIVPPTMATYNASGIAVAFATLNGEILALGGDNASERGFVYGLASNVYTATSSQIAVFGLGAYNRCVGTCNPPALAPGTTYYFRSFARNSAGCGYGPQLSFTTDTANYTPDVVVRNPGSDFFVCTINCTGTCYPGPACCTPGCVGSVTQPGVCYTGPVKPTFNFTYELINDGIGNPIYYWLVVDNNMDAAGISPSPEISTDWIGDNAYNISYTVTDPTPLEPNVFYRWKVSVVDSNFSVSGWTGADNGGFTTKPVCQPNPPINVNDTETIDEPPNCTQLTISWDDNSTYEVGYEVERTMILPIAGAPVTHCTIVYGTGLYDARSAGIGATMSCGDIVNPNATYNFRVKALGYPNDGTNDSVWVNAGNITTTPYCNPTLNNTTDYNCDCILIDWTMHPQADETQVVEYEIYRDVESTGVYSMIATSSQGVLNYDDCDILSGRTPYEYYVRAKSLDLDSSIISVTQPCPELPTWKESK